MKKSVAAAAAFAALITTPVLAADFALNAPAQIATSSWTGFYFGGNLGYGWGTVNADTTLINYTLAGDSIPNSNSGRLSGVVGGGQIGYNWQFSRTWIASLEADWEATGERSSLTLADPYAGGGFVGTGTAVFQTKLPWFGTVRGRVGYSPGNLLVYATGGLAYGSERISGTASDSGYLLGAPVPYNASTGFGSSKVVTGWTVGGGVEGPLANKWTWKLEYLYVDLGSLNFSSAGPFAGEAISEHAKFNDNVLRVGLNYHLN